MCRNDSVLTQAGESWLAHVATPLCFSYFLRFLATDDTSIEEPRVLFGDVGVCFSIDRCNFRTVSYGVVSKHGCVTVRYKSGSTAIINSL